ncbi:nucleotidyltransferase-like protein [Paenibacillus sp. NPDC058071]|uniref:nucleotidyltransferase-like protein n=1 Tax=Paenibacillus sp. NPDC058071 TaxID=3346326 RepID=UPI0036D85D11
MEQIKQHVMETFRMQSGVVSLALVENPYPYNPFTEGLDVLLLLISEEEGAAGTDHLSIDGDRVLVRTIQMESLQRWVVGGENRSIIEWIVRGEILMDRGGFLTNMREQIMIFPNEMREQKRLVEFNGFLRAYLQAKHELDNQNILDAYSHSLTALHHWAHIVLVEEGKHPELTVWKQMKHVHPGVYKLYEELTASNETLKQRVELVTLACEFTVMNKMKSCCSLLLDVIAEREEPWSIAELQNHREIEELQIDISLVVQNLVKRAYVREVAVMPNSVDTEALELKYIMPAI